MSFRKRNVALGESSSKGIPISSEPSPKSPPGVRPSPLDGRPTTSTGTQTLDDLMGGHAGLPLGCSLLIEENGTTDFAGALLRFYAAEGIVQGHQVHVAGVDQQWGRTLPGLASSPVKDDASKEMRADKEKMKIAWRYERLGDFGVGREGMKASPAPRRGPSSTPSTPDDNLSPNNPTTTVPDPPPFIHSFDLTKRLTPPPASLPINYISPPSTSTSTSSTPDPYTLILTTLTHSLTTTPPSTLHRLLIPSLLYPLLYYSSPSPSSSSTTTTTTSTSTFTPNNPTHLLPFLHSLRRLLRQFPTRLTAILTLPLALHPRSSGLTRWIERLVDGVLELVPFGYDVNAEMLATQGTSTNASAGSGASTSAAGGREKDEKVTAAAAQGILRVHSLPIATERGGGGGSGAEGEDWAFVLSRRRFVIRPFWLPPVEGEMDGAERERRGTMPKKEDIEF